MAASTLQIRVIVQGCFDRAKARLQADGFLDEAEALSEVTVHWLRHTGISDDVKRRDPESMFGMMQGTVQVQSRTNTSTSSCGNGMQAGDGS
ncbi:hypothetical protein [Candidatus Glomeribacter gigasporarum]|uniref:hypothetical protein n=1 Tax=Candidatus Glomeribacter gigasporarum TaxID=132144 RepID=UPI001939ADA5|nr:hypothetical protein [Candidatus Glomeribacter gigasporarum]